MEFYAPSENVEKRKRWAFAVGTSSPLLFACSPRALTGACQVSFAPLVRACAREIFSLRPNKDDFSATQLCNVGAMW